MGFSAMLAEEYILVDHIAIGCIMVRLFFATSIEVYSASAFLFIFSYRAEVTQNISTAESPDTLSAIHEDYIALKWSNSVTSSL